MDLSNDRKASNSMALVISKSRNGSNSMYASKLRDTYNSRKAKTTWTPAKKRR
jgi:hypothetical protein